MSDARLKRFLLYAACASSAAAAKKAVLRLVALDLLFCHDGEYKFTNPFFRHCVLKKSL